MRKPRDYDAELKALDEKAKQLRSRKTAQHGELVAATGADTLEPDLLAGGLLALVELTDTRRKEQLRERGAAFFRVRLRKAGRRNGDDGAGVAAADGGASQATSEADAA